MDSHAVGHKRLWSGNGRRRKESVGSTGGIEHVGSTCRSVRLPNEMDRARGNEDGYIIRSFWAGVYLYPRQDRLQGQEFARIGTWGCISVH